MGLRTLKHVSLGFVPSNAVVLVVQAAMVAAPRRVGGDRVRWMERFHSPLWALIPIASIVVVIFAIRGVSDTANGLTWLALIAVPILAAIALGWAMRGARWWLVGLAGVLLWLAWSDQHTLWGQGAAMLLTSLSCVTLGVLLATVCPPGWLKLGILLMAGADVWLVLSDLLQTPNTVLVLAAPGPGLPQLQSVSFGAISFGYGDMFLAGVLGGVLAREARNQWAMALLTLFIAGLLSLLFFVLSTLPATVPVALVVIITEAWRWRARRRTVVPAAGQWGSSPVEAGGRDSSASDVIARVPRAASSSTSVASSAERE